jgi:hypothetical protein
MTSSHESDHPPKPQTESTMATLPLSSGMEIESISPHSARDAPEFHTMKVMAKGAKGQE